MAAIYLIVFILCLLGLKFKENKDLFNGYLERDVTNSIKGIFICLVFVRHISPYIISAQNLCGGGIIYTPDLIALRIDNILAQLIVVMFLFYSGYGVAEAIRRKGNDYVRSIPQKRFFPTLIKFDIAVLCFAILAVLVGREFTIRQFFLSLTGWNDLGNSNWYIFCILYCYGATFIAHRISKAFKIHALPILFVLSIGYIIIMATLKSGRCWWFDTILAYWFGFIWSAHKNRIESIVKRIGYYWILGVVSLIFFVMMRYGISDRFALFFNATSLVFAMLTILMTMKFRVSHPVLIWLGVNLFPLYIYQRIPMIIFAQVNGGAWIAENYLPYIAACAIITILITIVYKQFNLNSTIQGFKSLKFQRGI